MPTDNERKANLDELTVLSKCLAGLSSDLEKQLLGEDDGLVRQFRAAIQAVLGRLGHGDPGVSKAPLKQIAAIPGLRGLSQCLDHACVLPDFIAKAQEQVNDRDEAFDSDEWLVNASSGLAISVATAKTPDSAYMAWITFAAIALVIADSTRNE